MAVTATDCLLNLYIRPDEPLYYPKGNERFVFDLPLAFYDVSEDVVDEFTARAGVELAVFPSDTDTEDVVKKLKALNIPTDLRHDQTFSVFNNTHKMMANRLIDIFLKPKTPEALLQAALYIRDRVNSMLFIYSLSVAILHRPDTKHLKIPQLSEVFPHLFISSDVIKHCQRQAMLLPVNCKIPYIDIPVDNTASDLDSEHRLAYFREDLGLCLHHWYWHLVYPAVGKLEIVDKDRRGELFYYMHQQMVARYNIERLANHLSRVVPLTDWQQPILEGYFSKVYSSKAGRNFAGRQRGTTLNDINVEGRRFRLQDMERARDRILEAIHRREVEDKIGKPISLNEQDGRDKGIDILGNIVEASDLSINSVLYGNLHNDGHIAISLCHDPDNRYLQGVGVMGTNETAVRDPIFYRWHAFIDNIFHEHKKLLAEYSDDKELTFRGIEIREVEVHTEVQEGKPPLKDTFQTFWQRSKVDIRGGLDLVQPGSPIIVRFLHLNHKQFTYQIMVQNNDANEKMGTVRIFMAPKKDERGADFKYDEQRLLMIELDKFTVRLVPGKNVIKRKSSESSVTVPFEQTFPPISEDHSVKPQNSDPEKRNYCGCGWPDHMLIPKGTEIGFPIDLFVMISDWVDDEVKAMRVGCNEGTACKDPASYCGLKDKDYPDARAMGFPFDRPHKPKSDKYYLKNFVGKNSNMFAKSMNIKFDNTPVEE